MAIITISRGSRSRGQEIAEKVAHKLGYDLVGREALLEASSEYNVPEATLVRAIHDAPSILDRFVGGKARYIAYGQAALTAHVAKDNVVYHGLAGHFLLRGVGHAVKVRIIAPLEYRVQVVMERDGVPREEALRILRKDDEQRSEWSRRLYGIDQSDPSLYDLVLNVDRISADDAASTICQVARLDGFRTTPESQKAMDDLALGAAVKSRLVDLKPDVEVRADGGVVHVTIGAYAHYRDALAREIRSAAEAVPGVREAHVELAVTPRAHG
ncbi:MAG: cytidylate kinase family protein [Deltaproteobacteria bacterium]|nr:cytidylate kinase family protein [Deltaproteobacteria bacterium]